MCCSQTIVNGSKGIAKNAVNLLGASVDEALPEIVKFRRDICRNCEHARKNPLHKDRVIDGQKTNGLTSLSQCELCSCLIKLKSTLASEKCPIGKWDSVEAQQLSS